MPQCSRSTPSSNSGQQENHSGLGPSAKKLAGLIGVAGLKNKNAGTSLIDVASL